jgi:hypothetical protein
MTLHVQIAPTGTPSPEAVVHPVYLPFGRDKLKQHFAPIAGGQTDDDKYLKYYEQSAALAMAHDREQHPRPAVAGWQPSGCSPQNHQVEKDERFWVVAALMAIYHVPDRVRGFSALLESGFPHGPALNGLTWAEALAEDEGPLHLYFEVNLPSPPAYRTWLAHNIEQRSLVPWIRAKNVGTRQEGATKVDAMLIAPKTGFAVVFEAKVLSDASSHTERDALRNQIARNIDVLLEANPKLQPPLSGRRPDRTHFVLLTPEVFKNDPTSRLYGWLMDSYRRDTTLLGQHLPHRQDAELQAMRHRIGWTTFEECNRIRPGALPWLPGQTPPR